MRNLRPREVASLLAKRPRAGGRDPMLLDVREPWEIAICRIDGSDSIPMRQLPGAAPSLERERPVICICHHGIRSLQVARYLEHLGFEDVINLEGGVDAWAREVDPDMGTY
jgi:rhodanese-related sulfurtransferase